MIISSDKSRKGNLGVGPKGCQIPISCIEGCIGRDVVAWLNAFAFHDAPECFGDVELWRVWRKKEDKQSPFLPYRPHLFHQLATVYFRIVENEKGLFFDCHGEFIKDVSHELGCDGICRREPMIVAFIVNHAKNVEPLLPLIRDADIFPRELPSVWHVSLAADMAFVTEIQIYQPGIVLGYKLLQLLELIFIELRRGFPLWLFSYTSKSCAKADKKDLNVLLHASFPVVCCHLSLAFMTLRRSFCIASITTDSSDASIMGLQPCPGWLRSPLAPSAKYRFTQRLTVSSVVDNCAAIFLEEVRPTSTVQSAHEIA